MSRTPAEISTTYQVLVPAQEITEEPAFPFVDRLGRRIGAWAKLVRYEPRELTLEESMAVAKYWTDYKGQFPSLGGGRIEEREHCTASRLVRLYVTATRGGRTYGASQRTKNFSAWEQGAAALAKYLDDSRKRAGKVNGAVPAVAP